MLSSKRINLIAAILTAATVVFVIIMLVSPKSSEKRLGEITYTNGQIIEYSAADYYSDYTKGDFNIIKFDGENIISSSNAVTVSGSDVTINGGGIYELSGMLQDGSVTVNANDGAIVELVFNGIDITSSDSAAIYIVQSAKTVISLVPGTVNTITDGITYTDNEVDSAIYSKDDLVINGEGTLVVNANYADGIKSNDYLKIMGGILQVNSVDEAINANDYIAITDGALTLASSGDAIKCGNDTTEGFIVFDGGTVDITSEADAVYSYSDIYVNGVTMNITATDDAVHAEGTLQLDSGKIDIAKCTEGLEGAYIVMNDGEYNIVSNDDGLNATGEGTTMGMRPGMIGGRGEMSSEVYLTINGGILHAQVGGDGLDSNAAAIINGGYIEVYGPENNGNSTLDFDGGFAINGGTVLAAGSSGMAESPADVSEQNVIVVALSHSYDAGTAFSVKDETGTEIATGTSAKKFDWICISSDAIKTDSNYIITVGDTEEANVTISSSVTSVRNSSSGGMGMPGGIGRPPQDMPHGKPPMDGGRRGMPRGGE